MILNFILQALPLVFHLFYLNFTIQMHFGVRSAPYFALEIYSSLLFFSTIPCFFVIFKHLDTSSFPCFIFCLLIVLSLSSKRFKQYNLTIKLSGNNEVSAVLALRRLTGNSFEKTIKGGRTCY